jgi:O-antigen/teichoic acid export membrane protein
MVLNGLGRLRGMTVLGVAAAVVNLALSILLGRKFGPSGVCWGTCIAALLPSIGVPLELHLVLRERSEMSRGATRL